MARGRQGTRRRPSRGAVAGRLIGAFALGTAVMGGGLYLFEHTQATDRRDAGRAVPPAVGRAEGLSELPAGAAPGATGRVGTMPSGKAAAGVPSAGDTATGTVGRGLPQAPFGESEEVFETGARVYVAQCAGCHGQPGRAGSAGGQVWGAGAAAVASEPVGLLYGQIANGVLPGMKGYRGELRETELWDLALLLHNAGQDLPDPVLRILRGHAGR